MFTPPLLQDHCKVFGRENQSEKLYAAGSWIKYWATRARGKPSWAAWLWTYPRAAWEHHGEPRKPHILNRKLLFSNVSHSQTSQSSWLPALSKEVKKIKFKLRLYHIRLPQGSPRDQAWRLYNSSASSMTPGIARGCPSDLQQRQAPWKRCRQTLTDKLSAQGAGRLQGSPLRGRRLDTEDASLQHSCFFL